MKFGKRQLILAVLVVALGAAVYLNWQFTNNDNYLAKTTLDKSSTTKEFGQAQYANTSLSSSKTESSKTEDSDKTDKSSSKTESAANTKNESDADTETNAANEIKEDVKQAANVASSKYFDDAVKARNEVQEKVLEVTSEILKSTESGDSERTAAIVSATEIVKIIEQQSNIENLIKSKGFDQCMAFIQNGECSVLVNKGVLSENLAVVIKDIVNSQSGVSFDKITITEV